MKPRILQLSRFSPAIEDDLAREFDIHPFWREVDPDAFLKEHGAEFTGLVTGSLTGVPAAVMGALPNLQVISNYGVGYEKIDLILAQRRGIVVGTTPDVLTDCVADMAFGLLLDVARNMSAADRFVRRGEWKLGSFYPLTTRVFGKRLGILGLGRIGRAIAKRSSGFEMEVHYHARQPVKDEAANAWTYETYLPALAEWADFLVIACSGGPATRHLVSEEVLSALGPSGIIVNIARGSVIDEKALVSALVEKRIAGAGLDVFEFEPHVPVELLSMPNVVLAPHMGSGTRETRLAMGKLMVDNLRHWYNEGMLLTPVMYQ